jgi:Raf kinase inhibitor-like YbhB/YbcL family protein
MDLMSHSFAEGERIPDDFAFGVVDPDTHVTFGPNKSPHLAWSDVPDDARSLAIVCVDSDVPTKPDDVNQEGREVPADLPRTDFYHWLLVDIPVTLRSLEPGAVAAGVVAHGKDAAATPIGKAGINDYTGWFVGDPDMEGEYFGYDGPCPPWNDSIIHRYTFTVYALDVDAVSVPDGFTGSDLMSSLERHVIDQASLTGIYSLNPNLL